MPIYDRLTLIGSRDRGHINLEPMAEPPSGNTGHIYLGTDNHLYIHNGSGWAGVGPEGVISGAGEIIVGDSDGVPTAGTLDTAVLTHYMTPSDDADENRAGVQALIDRVAPSGLGKGAKLFIPPRFDGSGNPDPIVLSKAGANAWAIDVPSDVTIEGAGPGSSFKLADGQANFARMFNVQGESNVVICNVRLDGNKAGNNATYEHNHNLFVWDSSDVVIEDVVSVDATGDGVYVGGSATGSQRIYLNRIAATGNLRNCVTAGQANDLWVTNSYLICDAASGGQAVDSEPTTGLSLGRLYVLGNVIGHDNGTVSGAYAVAMSGDGTNTRRSGVYIIGNEFRGGGLHGAWVDTVVIADNTGTINNVLFQRRHHDILLRGNIWDATTSDQVFQAESNSLTDYGERVHLIDNLISVPNGKGYRFAGITGVRVSGGVLRGGNVAATRGISVAATLGAITNISITNTEIHDFATAKIELGRSSTYTMENVTIANVTGTGTSTYGIDLTTADYITNLTIGPVQFTGNTQNLRIGNGTPYLLAGIRGGGAVWNCSGTPEGAITERVGAVAYRRDGGAGTTLYVKESGTGNTGWVAK